MAGSGASFLAAENKDVRPLRGGPTVEKLEPELAGGGSEAGVLIFLFTDKGVTGAGLEMFIFPLLEDPLSFLANFRSGDIDREIVPPPFSDPFSLPARLCLDPPMDVPR